MYTTGITKVLDLGLIVPLIIYTMILLTRKKPIGILFFNIIIGIGILIGFVVIGQTVYQMNKHIELTVGEVVVKGLIFSLLSIAGIIYQLKIALRINR